MTNKSLINRQSHRLDNAAYRQQIVKRNFVDKNYVNALSELKGEEGTQKLKQASKK